MYRHNICFSTSYIYIYIVEIKCISVFYNISSCLQPHHLVEWRVNRRYETLCSRHHKTVHSRQISTLPPRTLDTQLVITNDKQQSVVPQLPFYNPRPGSPGAICATFPADPQQYATPFPANPQQYVTPFPADPQQYVTTFLQFAISLLQCKLHA